jgi:hypothetical protein
MQLEYLLYALVGAPLVIGLIWLAVRSDLTVSFRKRSEEELGREVHSFGDVSEGHRPLTLFLAVLLVLFLVWAVAYTLHSGPNFLY